MLSLRPDVESQSRESLEGESQGEEPLVRTTRRYEVGLTPQGPGARHPYPPSLSTTMTPPTVPGGITLKPGPQPGPVEGTAFTEQNVSLTRVWTRYENSVSPNNLQFHVKDSIQSGL